VIVLQEALDLLLGASSFLAWNNRPLLWDRPGACGLAGDYNVVPNDHSSLERMDGLGTLAFAIHGKLLLELQTGLPRARCHVIHLYNA
jgi:hypothetical protein